MAYSVKEIYLTIQGEGFHTGRAAVFVRFAGCNLWTGREQDRSSAVCTFCDTDFVGTDGPGGGKFASAGDLARRVVEVWESGGALAASPVASSAASPVALSATSSAAFLTPSPITSPVASASHHTAPPPYVVCTGGEPLLQLDRELIDAFHAEGCEIAIETNGTIVAPEGIDWICVSPKADAPLVQRSGDELKLVYLQDLAPPERFADLNFDQFFLQPMDGPDADRMTAEAITYCLQHPQWRLSLQTHKFLGIP